MYLDILQSNICLRLSLLVSFTDCGRGKVWFEVGDSSDFRVSEDGVVSTLRRLSLAGKGKAVEVVYARDLQSKQVWKTRVHLRVRPTGNNAGPEQVKQQIEEKRELFPCRPSRSFYKVHCVQCLFIISLCWF